MGIQGLLSFLENASRPINIKEYSGCTVAIDTYCWLHKGAFSCAEKLARGEHTDQYVHYCMKYVNMLLSFNIKPILVFDGRHLPAKADTEKKRRELRESNRKRAAELLRLGRDSEARSLIQRCVDVTHEMASNLIKQCHSQGVDCIVAPYEADSQLAYLNLNGFAHIVITEDSDLILFGCKLVLFKMDLNGNGVLIEQSKIPLAMKLHPNQFTMDKFRYMCILSGCDYLKSLPGIGIAKACKFIKKTADPDIKRALTRLGAYLNMPNLVVSEDYRDKFIEADSMFKYQPVFDPLTRRVVTLNPLPEGVTNPLADTLSKEKSYQLALGNLNPFGLERVDNWDPDQPQAIKTNGWKTSIQRHKSIWSKDYQPPPPLPPKKDPRDVSRPTTKGKTAVQPVTVLTEKIAALTPKPNIEEEISRLRDSFGVKTPLTNKLYNSDEEVVKKKNSLQEDDIFQEILKTPEKKESTEFTLDDILNGDDSPVLDGKVWRNPFSAKTRLKKEVQCKKPGGALDRFSKLRRTVVEEACIVQSRYFSSPDSEKKVMVEKYTTAQKTPSSNLSGSLEDILASSPVSSKSGGKGSTPKKNSFLITDINDSSEKSSKKMLFSSPSKNNFSVSSIDNDIKKADTTIIRSLSPRKNLFCVSNAPETSPKQQSFLSIIDSVSKNPLKTAAKNEKPIKKLSSPTFKWQQPLIQYSFKKGLDENEVSDGNKKMKKEPNQPGTSRVPVLKTPKNSLSLIKSKSPAIKKRAGGLLEKNNLKKRTSEPGITQPSIFDMFAFQSKPKLKML